MVPRGAVHAETVTGAACKPTWNRLRKWFGHGEDQADSEDRCDGLRTDSNDEPRATEVDASFVAHGEAVQVSNNSCKSCYSCEEDWHLTTYQCLTKDWVS